MGLGNQGVAMIPLAERTKNATIAETACQQIEVALETMRSSGHASFAAYYESRLREARRIRCQRLADARQSAWTRQNVRAEVLTPRGRKELAHGRNIITCRRESKVSGDDSSALFKLTDNRCDIGKLNKWEGTPS